MKTTKQIAVAVAIAVLAYGAINLSKKNVKEIRTSLHESTHQGYRSMVADYIF
jgi:hypothetical protein